MPRKCFFFQVFKQWFHWTKNPMVTVLMTHRTRNYPFREGKAICVFSRKVLRSTTNKVLSST